MKDLLPRLRSSIPVHSIILRIPGSKSLRFNTLLGLPAGQDITLADTGTVSAYEGPVAQAIQTALMQRADLKQVRQEEKAAQQGIQIAKSGQLPTVSLSLKKDWQNQAVPANPLSAQVALSFNVFDGNKTKAKIKQTEWETSQKHELLQQKTEQVTLETQETYFNMQNARTDLDIASTWVNLIKGGIYCDEH